MSSQIETYLEQILEAVYGKDVRSAIHDAISQCYTDVSTSTTSATTAAASANSAASAATTAANRAEDAAQQANLAALNAQEFVPTGGTTGQVLAKASGTDYDTEWTTVEAGGGTVTDVQVNGVSVLDAQGVANVPIASRSTPGVVRVQAAYGIRLQSDNNSLRINEASDATIKAGTDPDYPIVSKNASTAAFYGLAKAAGDTTQSASSNAVGSYTDEAKAAIQTMLGVEQGVNFVEEISGTAVTITGVANTRYKCGTVTTISITPPSLGTIDVVFTSGSTAAALTLPSTVKVPDWFDPTALDTDTTYELVITDGVYCGVMAWAE